MSQMVAVADAENAEEVTKADVKAFLNGSDFAKEDKHGKMILAGGIPEGENALEERAKSAATRLYADGSLITKKAKIGPMTVGEIVFKYELGTGKGLFIEKERFSIESTAYVGRILADISFSCPLNTYGDSTFMFSDGGPEESEFIRSLVWINASIHSASSTKNVPALALGISAGQVGGLRPRTRDIESGTILSALDYNVFIPTGYVYLPKNPQTGQTYRIYHTSTNVLYIMPEDGFAGQIRWLKGNQGVTINNTIESHRAHVLELVFGGVDWYLTFDLADNGNV